MSRPPGGDDVDLDAPLWERGVNEEEHVDAGEEVGMEGIYTSKMARKGVTL